MIKDKIQIENIEIILTKGKHGTGAVGISMGKSYSFILKTKNEGTVYITGDTIWCKCVEKTIGNYKPGYIIGFSGAATIKNTHITLNESDIRQIMGKSDAAKIIVNHMDAWNHCLLTRDKLKEMIQSDNLYIPNDGETITV